MMVRHCIHFEAMTMRNSKPLLAIVVLSCIALGGCAVAPPTGSSNSDGKCHGDYNASSCVYLF
jgi:hypothetical protein